MWRNLFFFLYIYKICFNEVIVYVCQDLWLVSLAVGTQVVFCPKTEKNKPLQLMFERKNSSIPQVYATCLIPQPSYVDHVISDYERDLYVYVRGMQGFLLQCMCCVHVRSWKPWKEDHGPKNPNQHMLRGLFLSKNPPLSHNFVHFVKDRGVFLKSFWVKWYVRISISSKARSLAF